MSRSLLRGSGYSPARRRGQKRGDLVQMEGQSKGKPELLAGPVVAKQIARIPTPAAGGGGFPGILVVGSDAPDHVKALAVYECDGAGDEVEIQAALDDANDGSGNPLETVFLYGTFTLDNPVNITNVASVFYGGIQGFGWPNTLVTNSDAFLSGYPDYTGYFEHDDYIDRFFIRDIGFYNKNGSDPLYSPSGKSFYAWAANYAFGSYTLELSNCYLHDIGGLVSDYELYDCRFVDNYAFGTNGSHAGTRLVALWGSTGGFNVLFSGNQTRYFDAVEGHFSDSAFVGNQLRQGALSDIGFYFYEDSTDLLVASNVFEDYEYAAFYCDIADNSTFVGNHVEVGFNAWGTEMYDPVNIAITNNAFSGPNGDYGVALWQGVDNFVFGNRIEAKTYGVHLSGFAGGAGNIVYANDLRNCVTGLQDDDGSSVVALPAGGNW